MVACQREVCIGGFGVLAVGLLLRDLVCYPDHLRVAAVLVPCFAPALHHEPADVVRLPRRVCWVVTCDKHIRSVLRQVAGTTATHHVTCLLAVWAMQANGQGSVLLACVCA